MKDRWLFHRMKYTGLDGTEFEIFMQVLKGWINVEKYGRSLLFIYCEMKKYGHELQSFQS
jgi:hypothetical protein